MATITVSTIDLALCSNAAIILAGLMPAAMRPGLDPSHPVIIDKGAIEQLVLVALNASDMLMSIYLEGKEVQPVGRRCRLCGCTDDKPCTIEKAGFPPVSCAWVEADLCSHCLNKLESEALAVP